MSWLLSAASSLVGGAGSLPYYLETGTPDCPPNVYEFELSGFKLHNGTLAKDGTAVSVFVLDKQAASEDQLAIAKHGLQKLKTTRHPNVLVFIDSVETDSVLALVTESVQCLAEEAVRQPGPPTWLS